MDSWSLQDLTIKITMLLALTCPCRGTDLAELDLNYRLFLPEGCYLPLSKQSQPSHNSVNFFFPAIKDDKNGNFKGTYMREKQLLVQGETIYSDHFIEKHGPVTSSTVARWKAGIDISKFLAHSVRAAANSTAAMSGLIVEDILKAADRFS